MKLIKNGKIVKIPKVTNSVSRALSEARNTSCERAWNKVIVIGESSVSGGFYTSSMHANDVIAMLERVKFELLKE